MAHANRIRILVLYDDPFARAGLSTTFARYPDLEVVNADGDALLALPTPRQLAGDAVDVVVADYANGVELAALGSRQIWVGEQCRIMIVASIDREWEIRHAMANGVRGYVLFGCPLDELASGVRAVRWGQRHLSTKVAQRLAESLSGETLTCREEEVLRLVVEGMGNKAIARRLNIAVGTVKSHLKGIFDKLNVESRTQAICATERRGLLSPLPQQSRAALDGEVSTVSNSPVARVNTQVERASVPLGLVRV